MRNVLFLLLFLPALLFATIAPAEEKTAETRNETTTKDSPEITEEDEKIVEMMEILEIMDILEDLEMARDLDILIEEE